MEMQSIINSRSFCVKKTQAPCRPQAAPRRHCTAGAEMAWSRRRSEAIPRFETEPGDRSRHAPNRPRRGPSAGRGKSRSRERKKETAHASADRADSQTPSAREAQDGHTGGAAERSQRPGVTEDFRKAQPAFHRKQCKAVHRGKRQPTEKNSTARRGCHRSYQRTSNSTSSK